ncbi:DUF3159 domain-containing protein [Fodinicola acaciae]|uniref:DUF3159 domain-containing protein n=1 Tax=Fodinicola acaciae TaxID=2681555 RepID=UPI0013D2240E|nr:DUF3159 domain-containing protein [Fodinicola acaciae]
MTSGESRLEKPTTTSEPGSDPNPDDISIREYFASGEFRREVARQLGGWTGIAESAIPVVVFVIANTFLSLYPALIAAVAAALLIAGFRLLRKQSPRQALNGLVGIAIAAIWAARTGRAQDFYLPGILISYAYTLVIAGSVLFRRPLVGVVWAFFGNIGSEWRRDRGHYRMFFWLTLLWAVVWFAKVSVQAWLYVANASAAELGVARIIFGNPPIVLLIVVTAWVVRRHNKRHGIPEPTPETPAAEA